LAATSGKPYDFNQYAAGAKIYNGGSNSPHQGMMLDPLGYKTRDAITKARRNAMLRRLKAGDKKDYMNSSWLGGPEA